jgi:sulfite reductase beta subunit-like hemoprotein
MKKPLDATRPVNRINVTVWLSVKEAAKKLSVSTDTIERRAIEWQESPERYKVRYKYLVLDEGAEPVRRYYEPDVEAMLCEPKLLPAASRARLVPKRLQSSSGIA